MCVCVCVWQVGVSLRPFWVVCFVGLANWAASTTLSAFCHRQLLASFTKAFWPFYGILQQFHFHFDHVNVYVFVCVCVPHDVA